MQQHQRQKTCAVIHILAHLRAPMGKCILKDAPVAWKQSRWRTHTDALGLSWNLKHIPKRCSNSPNAHSAHKHAEAEKDAGFLTLVWQLAHVRRNGHVQHVVDGRVNIVPPLDVVLAVGLVALLVAAVLQTVPLQVLECRCATWGPGGRKGKCWLTVTSPYYTLFFVLVSLMVGDDLSIFRFMSLFFGLFSLTHSRAFEADES